MILIHQAIYGELDSSKGYHLLSSSFMDSDIPKRLSNSTDLIDRPPNSMLSTPVLRGFSEGEYYLLIKTFPDFSTNVRKGRVFSHVLIINKSDLDKIIDFKELLNYHLTEVDKYAKFDQIEIQKKDSISSNYIYTERIAYAINGIVNHNKYNNTIVWVGEDGYTDLINALYKNLPVKVKTDLKIGVAYAPQRINKELLNIVYIPTEINQNWLRSGFKIVDYDDNEKPESQAANLLLGNKKIAEDLYNLINDFSLRINEVDDFAQLEKVIPAYLGIGKKSIEIKRLLILADLISAFSSKPNLSKDKKVILLQEIALRLIDANSIEILILPNINWKGFSDYKTYLINVLNGWLSKNLFSKKLLKENAVIVKKGLTGVKEDWWSNTIKNHLTECLLKWKEDYSLPIWTWFKLEPELIDVLEFALPDKSENDLLDIPNLNSEIGGRLLSFCINKKWYKLHAILCCKLYTSTEALDKHLLVDTVENYSDGLREISNCIPEKLFIDYSVSNTSKRLVDISVELIQNKPKLFSNIDVSYQGWIDIWSASEDKGISAFDNISRPINLTYKLLKEYIGGKEVNDNLLNRVSTSNFNNLSDFPERSKLWKEISNPIKANFVNATTSLCTFQKYLLINNITFLEEKLIDTNSEEKYVKGLISNEEEPINSNLLLGFFEKFSLTEDLLLFFLEKRYLDFDTMLSKRLGELIHINNWENTHKLIKNKYVHLNQKLKIAIEYSSSMLFFKSIFSLSTKKNKNTKNSDSMKGNNIEAEAFKKILIVVATEVEAREVLGQAKENNLTPTHKEIGKIVIWNLGLINKNVLVMLKIGNMGSGGAAGSALSIKDAIDEIKPERIIMVGIAFGLNKKSQQIGDILVSKQLTDYELKKEKNGTTINRADKISAGITLVSRFENSLLTYSKHNVRFGLIISGNTLLDDEEVVDKLKLKYPEAIGGEMEGSGLQGTCHREGIEWILMKGICDWGYNKQSINKEADQKSAIANVCDFLFYTINDFEM